MHARQGLALQGQMQGTGRIGDACFFAWADVVRSGEVAHIVGRRALTQELEAMCKRLERASQAKRK